MIPEGEVGCKFCEKSIYRIFVEHIQDHMDHPQVTEKGPVWEGSPAMEASRK
jgi:hypothetical protein